jgi:hypothetical protein
MLKSEKIRPLHSIVEHRTASKDLKKTYLQSQVTKVLSNQTNNLKKKDKFFKKVVLRIRIQIRIHKFLCLLDLDPLVKGMVPNPSIIKQK